MAEIKVDLRLATEGLRQQAAQAGAQVKSGFEGMRGMKASDAFERLKANQAAAAGGGGGGNTQSAMIGGIAGGLAGVAASIIKDVVVQMIGAIKRAIVDAFKEAASLYSKQLTSGGMSAGMITKRSLISEVMGVGEKDVWQYGKAVSYLNEKIRLSTDEIQKNIRPLTAVTWSWRLMGINMRALMSQIGAGLAPAFKQFADLVSSIIEFVRETGYMQLSISVLKSAFVVFNVTIALVAVAMAEIIQQFVMFADLVKFIGGAKNPFQNSKAGAEAIQKMISSLGDKNAKSVVPEAAASANRLQTSHWERMGMVIGQGIGNNPMRATERNTRKTADLLKDIRAFLSPRNAGTPNLSKTAVNGA